LTTCQLFAIFVVKKAMTTITVGDLKGRFSEILKRVQQGEVIAVAFGRRKEVLAYIIPKAALPAQEPRPLGLLAGQATFALHGNFSISEEEFLSA
jgi:antitoxin (DNA-binding transcriptional repressor) of toxin-antitoxin stability system